MTWIIHKGDRKQIFNAEMSQSIHIGSRQADDTEEWLITIWYGTIPVELEYPNEKDAQQAFKYLMEAIKKGERLAHI